MYHALIFNLSIDQFNRPGGAHRIATWLRDENWDVEVCDWADDWNLDELQEFAKSRISINTKFLGFSCFFDHWSDKINNFVHWLKLKYPNITIIRGGQVAPKFQYSSFKLIDYHVSGYGEFSIIEIIKKILGNSNIKLPLDPNFLLKGIKLIDGNKFFSSWPMYSAKIIYEHRDFIEPWEWLTTEFARGCKFQCPYCNFPVLGVKGDHTRDAEDFDYQLRHAYDNWGVTNYYCADETFNDRSEKIIKFADIAEKFNFNPFFTAFVRADLVAARPQDWEHFLRLGVLGHFYGVETFNHESAKIIGKGMKFEKITQGLLDSKNYWLKQSHGRYRGGIALIIGLPKETKETVEKTFNWIRENWQGQSYMAWPLEISKNTGIDRESLISKDYKKYGYRELIDRDNNILNQILVGNNADLLNWTNENFTFREATEIANKFQLETMLENYNYTIEPFDLARTSIIGDVDNSLTYTKKNLQYVDYKSPWQSYKRRYINKKLSYL